MKILLASHGKMAQGMANTLHLFLGDLPNLSCICAYIDETPVAQQLDAYFSAIPGQTPVIVFTDLFGGSVNTEIQKYRLEHPQLQIHLIAGMNLSVILEIAMLPEDQLNNEMIASTVKNAQSTIVYVNECKPEAYASDEI